MKTTLRNKTAYFIICIGVAMPILAFAQPSCTGPGICNPLASSDFTGLVKNIANLVAQIGGVVAVIFIIYAGFLFVTARGDERQLATAKSTFYWTIIGTAILLGAYAIASAIVNLVKAL